MFTDTAFGGDAAIGDVSIKPAFKPVRWRRASELRKDLELFSTIEADNIQQGGLGDCWLLAAIAVLADFPGHIRTLFENSEVAHDGKYTIRLYDLMNGWEDVVIDDLIPCSQHGHPLFAQIKGKSGCLWPLLLEKAFAKFIGSYGGLVAGNAFWAWQVLTGQAHQAKWELREERTWIRFKLDKLKDAAKTDAGHEFWRTRGMRKTRWIGPEEKLGYEEMFQTLAACTQACYPMACAVHGGGGSEDGPKEEKRSDGLIANHQYSIVQVVCAQGVELVQLRNPWGSGGEWRGKWGDSSEEWRQHPNLAQDLQQDASNDGRFFMPWQDFVRIFGRDINVCPITLPCPLNTQLSKQGSSGGAGGLGASKPVPGHDCAKCPTCSQPYTKRWVLLTDDTWYRLNDGEVCFVCLRATIRARNPRLHIAGVHTRPTLSFAPPPPARRLELCRYDACCYRRNPDHFQKTFHPSLLPPAPPCLSGCGRTASSCYPTCCRRCTQSPPDLSVHIPDSCPHWLRKFGGTYRAEKGRTVRGAPVWKHSHNDSWLWRVGGWMIGAEEEKVGAKSGCISSKGSAAAPFLPDTWQYADKGGWKDSLITVQLLPGFVVEHDKLCNDRAAREASLVDAADAVLRKGGA